MRTFELKRLSLRSFMQGDLSFYSLVFIMILFPLRYKFLPPFMLLLCLGRILEISYRKKDSWQGKKYAFYLCSLFVAFFLWQTVTVVYSENSSLAWSNVFGRLSLLVFPLSLFDPGEKIRTNKLLLLRIFAISSCLYLLICYGRALDRSISFPDGKLVFNPHPTDENWLNYFFEMELTGLFHPTYLSMYVLLSVIISFESSYHFEKQLFLQVLWIIMAIFLLISLYFISSRAGMLAAIIIVPLYLIIRIKNKKKHRILWILVLVLMITSIPIILKNEKVNNLIAKFSENGLQDDRVSVWKSVVAQIRDNPVLGVGIGDVRDELTKKYEENGQSNLMGLNAHNQFLEVMLEGGVIELFFFVSIFLLMCHISIKEVNAFYGIYILMMIIFFMFETTLYRLAGVAFFSLFSFLLLPQFERKKEQ